VRCVVFLHMRGVWGRLLFWVSWVGSNVSACHEVWKYDFMRGGRLRIGCEESVSRVV
jgi:hypothetical protein